LQAIPADNTVCVELPGGGGFGDPTQRPAALVERDIKQGYITSKTRD
jgi:N-methylhydantoinase B